jgi:hypothetical protein
MEKTRSLRFAALAASTLAMAAAVPAQQFAFQADTLSATAGQNATLEVFLSGSSAPVAAVNFTVRVSAAGAGALQLAQATSTSPLEASGFVYEFNPDYARSSVSTGTIQGDVVEFRGVLYPSGGASTTFSASASTKIAEIVLPVSASAPSGTINVELVSAIDGGTGLLGVSDAAGTSLKPQGQTRPGGDIIAVTVGSPGLMGDLDGNGSVTPNDAQLAFECFLLGGNCPPAVVDAAMADFCGTGNGITPGDAQGIFNVFLGITNPCN